MRCTLYSLLLMVRLPPSSSFVSAFFDLKNLSESCLAAGFPFSKESLATCPFSVDSLAISWGVVVKVRGAGWGGGVFTLFVCLGDSIGEHTSGGSGDALGVESSDTVLPSLPRDSDRLCPSLSKLVISVSMRD